MGEYEPDDSRNVTGTASTPDGRWTNAAAKSPAGVPDDAPVSAEEAANPDVQPPISDEPPVVEDRDELPGTPRPAPR